MIVMRFSQTVCSRIFIAAAASIVFVYLHHAVSVFKFSSWVKVGLQQLVPESEVSGPTNTTIMIWLGNHAFVQKFRNKPPFKLRMREECGGCLVTNDKNELERADSVLFHPTFLEKTRGFPERSRRSPRQIYAFWSGENPYFTMKILKEGGQSLKDFDGDFNLTITYRQDSIVTKVYGCWQNLQLQPVNFSQKNASAAILASDCVRRVGAKMRLEYVQSLIKAGLEVHGYGNCFGKRYEGDISQLLKSYKFYLAFENSVLCRDYITEKFWENSLNNGLVPVVWGTSKADVERVAPPNSFIHVSDFTSAAELADFLIRLDQDDDAYKEYFKWRTLEPPAAPNDKGFYCPKHYFTEPDLGRATDKAVCALCRYMKAAHINPGDYIIPSLSKWWYGTDTAECYAQELTETQKVMLKTQYNFTP